MRRVGIVTLFRSNNHGAFLQAYALQKYLTQAGCDVELVDTFRAADWLKLLKTVVKPRSRTWKEIPFNIVKYLRFSAAARAFDVVPAGSLAKPGYFDAVLIGSDEVWNIRNPTFTPLPCYYGAGIETPSVVFYAVAAGTTSLGDTFGVEYIESASGRWRFVSVRDERARDIAEHYFDKEVAKVVDPTLLVDLRSEAVDSKLRGFLLVYSYMFDPDYRREVIDFARRRRLKLVSAGFFADWCDVVVNPSPFELLGLVQAADYVVTDTYHGTLFSIIFGKRYAVYPGHKEKLLDLLRSYDLLCRSMSRPGALLESVLEGENHSGDGRRLQEAVDRSHRFLDHALVEIGCR